MCFFAVFFLPVIPSVQGQEKDVEVSSFEELCQSMDQMKSSGGTIVLTQDITISPQKSYTYNNGRYRKEIVIETNGHTIYVEGTLSLWPYLTIRTEDDTKEIFHVKPGGKLELTSICVDAGDEGTAIIQEEGAFLVYGSEEGLGLPTFVCIGEIHTSSTITAAASWHYDCDQLPVVRIPAGIDFSADMLPERVKASINRNHQEYEEEVPVVWDESTFPSTHDRTLIQGTFAQGYTTYGNDLPQCLVIWESASDPFFLNVYLQSLTQNYDLVWMYGEAPQSGIVTVQSSEDGTTWEEITGTEGYASLEVEKSESFFWLLSYDQGNGGQQRPTYYRLVQTFDDGTKRYSQPLELSEDFIFTTADIEGGRGGETSPNEGEDQLTNETVDQKEESELPPLSSNASTSPELVQSGEKVDDAQEISTKEDEQAITKNEETTDTQSETMKTTSNFVETLEQKQTTDTLTDAEAMEAIHSEKENVLGLTIVACVLAGCVVFYIIKK